MKQLNEAENYYVKALKKKKSPEILYSLGNLTQYNRKIKLLKERLWKSQGFLLLIIEFGL